MKPEDFARKMFEECNAMGLGAWNTGSTDQTRFSLGGTVSIKVYEDGYLGFMWWKTNMFGFGCWEIWGENPLINIDDESAVETTKKEILKIKEACEC